MNDMPVPVETKSHLLNIVSGAALLFAASWFSYNIFQAKDSDVPPRIMKEFRIEPSILLVGKPFTIHATSYLSKLCPYEVHWSLVRKSDRVEVVRIVEPVQPAAKELGDVKYDITRYVPAGTAPGDYQYVSDTTDICPDRVYPGSRRATDITIR